MPIQFTSKSQSLADSLLLSEPHSKQSTKRPRLLSQKTEVKSTVQNSAYWQFVMHAHPVLVYTEYGKNHLCWYFLSTSGGMILEKTIMGTESN